MNKLEKQIDDFAKNQAHLIALANKMKDTVNRQQQMMAKVVGNQSRKEIEKDLIRDIQNKIKKLQPKEYNQDFESLKMSIDRLTDRVVPASAGYFERCGLVDEKRFEAENSKSLAPLLDKYDLK